MTSHLPPGKAQRPASDETVPRFPRAWVMLALAVGGWALVALIVWGAIRVFSNIV